jgi:hypothetical protein
MERLALKFTHVTNLLKEDAAKFARSLVRKPNARVKPTSTSAKMVNPVNQFTHVIERLMEDVHKYVERMAQPSTAHARKDSHWRKMENHAKKFTLVTENLEVVVSTNV